jgi:hypothetical protein
MHGIVIWVSSRRKDPVTHKYFNWVKLKVGNKFYMTKLYESDVDKFFGRLSVIPPLSSGQTVTFTYDKARYKDGVWWIHRLMSIKVTGFVSKYVKQTFMMDNVKFYDGAVGCYEDNANEFFKITIDSGVWEDASGFKPYAILDGLKKIIAKNGKSFKVKVEGEARVKYTVGGTPIFHITDPSKVEIDGLDELRDAYQVIKRREIRKVIREITKAVKDKPLTHKDVMDYISGKDQFPNISPLVVDSVEGDLISACMKKGYEEQYIEYLKSIKNPDSQIYVSENGFFFHIKDKTVWEVPVANFATYVFKGSPNEVLPMIYDVSRNVMIRVKNIPTEELMGELDDLLEGVATIEKIKEIFVGRAYHTSFDEWEKQVDELVGVSNEDG